MRTLITRLAVIVVFGGFFVPIVSAVTTPASASPLDPSWSISSGGQSGTVYMTNGAQCSVSWMYTVNPSTNTLTNTASVACNYAGDAGSASMVTTAWIYDSNFKGCSDLEDGLTGSSSTCSYTAPPPSTQDAVLGHRWTGSPQTSIDTCGSLGCNTVISAPAWCTPEPAVDSVECDGLSTATYGPLWTHLI